MESKVRTTYNEVADELVSEFGNVEGTGVCYASGPLATGVLLVACLVQADSAATCLV